VAKYFAIIPAIFLAFYPQLQALSVMNLANPQSAILSAIIFNADRHRLDPKADMEKVKAENPTASIPIDLVATSGSGLDPDISPEAAPFQVTRVAKARNMPQDRIRDLVNQHSEGRVLGLIGEPRVNVLNLKRAFDRLAGG
jgi:K+-transporting ATPase KdpC subunit